MKERSDRIEFHRNYCVNYQPREHLCAAGMDCQKIPREAPEGEKVKWAPCIKGHLVADPLSLCPHWERKSLESAEAYADSVERSLNMLAKAMPVISEWRKKPPKGKTEIIECPVCGGSLVLSQSSYNGHVHAACETENCVAFME